MPERSAALTIICTFLPNTALVSSQATVVRSRPELDGLLRSIQVQLVDLLGDVPVRLRRVDAVRVLLQRLVQPEQRLVDGPGGEAAIVRCCCCVVLGVPGA